MSDDWKIFFEKHKHYVSLQAALFDQSPKESCDFSLEELYQAFKARLKEEEALTHENSSQK